MTYKGSKNHGTQLMFTPLKGHPPVIFVNKKDIEIFVPDLN